MPEKDVDLVQLFVKKAFVWEVHFRVAQQFGNRQSLHPHLFVIVKQVPVGHGTAMVAVNNHLLIADEAGCDQGVVEAEHRLGVIANAKQLADIDFGDFAVLVED